MQTGKLKATGFGLALLLSPVAEASEVGKIGSSDLKLGPLTCSANERITGAEFRYGHWVDHVKIFCTPFGKDNRPSGPKRVSAKLGGGGGEASVVAECAPGSWVAGATAKVIDQMVPHGETTPRDYLARVRLACINVGNIRSDLAETAHINNYGYVTHRAGCAAAQAATGFWVYGDGRWVTGLGLLCEARPGLKSVALAALPPAKSVSPDRIPWPNQQAKPSAPASLQDRKAQIIALVATADSHPLGSPASNAAWEQAAALGDVYSRRLLGHRFCDGQYVQKDERRCHSIFLMLAEEGVAKAQTFVGRLYQAGAGTPRDIDAARYWYEKAANQGEADAMGYLGNIYDPMENHYPNMELATFWKRMSYKNGNDIAYYWLKQRNLLERAPDEQAFINRIETQGPDRSNLSHFNYEVAVYCQYGGNKCHALRAEGYRAEKAQNAQAAAANTQRLWNVYRREAQDPMVRANCLARASESLHKATYGQQSWYYSADNC